MKFVNYIKIKKLLILLLLVLYTLILPLSCAPKNLSPIVPNNTSEVLDEPLLNDYRKPTPPEKSNNNEPKVSNSDFGNNLWDMPPKLGLLRIKDVISDVKIDLKYGGNENFVGENMYGENADAWLQPEVLDMLRKAQDKLKSGDSNLTLVVYDAARPHRVQERMWEIVKGTRYQAYVASPKSISLHTYGVAVDLSIWDKRTSSPLDMGTAFDSFSPESSPSLEAQMLKTGKLTQKQINNRELLRRVMYGAGFKGISNEWWHFNALSKSEAAKKYKVIP